IIGRHLCRHLVLPGGDRVGGAHLQLDVLGLAGIEPERIELLAACTLAGGGALSSWLPYCSVKVASKFCGACADRLTRTFLPLSFLMASGNSKFDFEVPRSSGNCGVSVTFAGRSVASVTATGSEASTAPPFAFTVRLVVPIGASF